MQAFNETPETLFLQDISHYSQKCYTLSLHCSWILTDTWDRNHIKNRMHLAGLQAMCLFSIQTAFCILTTVFAWWHNFRVWNHPPFCKSSDSFINTVRMQRFKTEIAVKVPEMQHAYVVRGWKKNRSDPSVKGGFYRFSKFQMHEGSVTEELSRRQWETFCWR